MRQRINLGVGWYQPYLYTLERTAHHKICK
jgi:hypothetical protein